MRDMSAANSALFLLASQLDGIEELRKATDNRFRQATRSVADADGEVRGFGLSETDPGVVAVKAASDNLAKLEHEAILSLQRAMRRHPLGRWQKQQIGIGEKQLGRLLAAIGDPYWNTLHDRPRTVSELWSYSGLHTVSSSAPDQLPVGAHAASVRGAARRTKGQRANWSTDAKTRAYLIAESCVKQSRSPYRETYERRRAAVADRVHDRPCPQCNGKGKTELIISPWRAGHQHADALRIVSKTVLRDLWVAARDWHAAN
jgi:hypothetical protein